MNKRIINRWVGLIAVSMLLSLSTSLKAEAPTGYYDSVDTSSPQALHTSLHEIIDDHQRFPYTSTATDTWDILESADEDPNNPSNVLDIYKNASYAKEGGGNSFYNREHSWPKSYGFPSDGSSNYPYTDAHHLFISDSSYNSSRSNKPYDNCTSGCTEKITEFNNGRGGISIESNWTTGSFTQGKWETWSGRKGEVARALLYMAVRYEGGTHGVTGYTEPDLRLTDDLNLIEQSNAGSNIDLAYMGLRSVLLQWHQDDPVDDLERRRNDIVFSHQGNRNPFIDHPEYVDCVFAFDCSALGGGSGDTTPPAAPLNLNAVGGDAEISLDWSANVESDLSGYYVYRSDVGAGSYTRVNVTAISTNSFVDSNLPAESSFDYYVTAIDTSGNESMASNIATATTSPSVGGESAAWINEFHYDNSGTDVDEMVEIAGSAGMDLNGWQLIGYNGNGGSSYKTVNLSGIIPNQSQGFGTLQFAFTSMQNGSPDGLALVDNTGAVINFISYEGALTATNGAATGMTSTDVGVSETSSTAVGFSLQLIGTGTQYSDFTWQGPTANSAGSINQGQSFSGGSQPAAPTAVFTYSCIDLTCSFDGTSSTAPDSSISSYNWDFSAGNLAAGASVEYTFPTEGSYTVSLEVLNAEGMSDSVTQVISVTAPTGSPSYYENTTSISLPSRGTRYSDLDVDISSTMPTATVSVDISHTFRGDISLLLYAPNGDRYNLKSKNSRDGGQNIVESYVIELTGDTSGVWTLRVKDHYSGDSGTLNQWSIQF
jgi:endonuclease I